MTGFRATCGSVPNLTSVVRTNPLAVSQKTNSQGASGTITSWMTPELADVRTRRLGTYLAR